MESLQSPEPAAEPGMEQGTEPIAHPGARAAMPGADGPVEVARLVEALRITGARLSRQRQDETGLNDTDRAAIRYLVEHGLAEVEITPSKLAEHLQLSTAGVTIILDRLAVNGIVSVAPHPSDRRKKLIALLDTAVDIERLDPATTSIRQLAALLTEDEAAVVAGFLRRVLEILADRRRPS